MSKLQNTFLYVSISILYFLGRFWVGRLVLVFMYTTVKRTIKPYSFVKAAIWKTGRRSIPETSEMNLRSSKNYFSIKFTASVVQVVKQPKILSLKAWI